MTHHMKAPAPSANTNSSLPPGVFPARSLVTPTIPTNAFGMVTAQLRIIGQQYCLSKGGAPYTRLYLGNSTGSIVAIAWHDAFLPAELVLEHGQVAAFTGKVRTIKGQPILNLRQVEPVHGRELTPSGLLPVEWVVPRFRTALITLVHSWNDVGNHYIRAFLADVFANTALAMGFLNGPASKSYHHAYQGGLLEHSTEMLVGLRNELLYQADSLERDLAITLAIIHDLGKTVTLVGTRYNERGAHQPHEMAALEMLAAPMHTLERNLPVAANLIRGYFKPRNWFPAQKARLYSVVSRLDRDSAQRNHELTNSQ